MSAPARLLLVDDHPIVREGLRAYLGMQPDLEVAAEAGSLAEARALPEGLALDLALVDLRLPDGDALPLVAELRARPAAPRVLVLTSFLDERAVRGALRAGASGYLLKHAGPRALLDHVRAALRGEMPMDPDALKALARPAEPDPFAELTAREREVLSEVAAGRTNAEVAARLGIAEKTVKAHLTSVYAKTGARDRVEAVLRAREAGLDGRGAGRILGARRRWPMHPIRPDDIAAARIRVERALAASRDRRPGRRRARRPAPLPKETSMHPSAPLLDRRLRDRLADARTEREADRLARTARTARAHRPAHPVRALAGRALRALRAAPRRRAAPKRRPA